MGEIITVDNRKKRIIRELSQKISKEKRKQLKEELKKLKAEEFYG